MYALYAGDFDTALKQAQSILQENPKFDQALRTSALAELGLGHTAEVAGNYEKLQAVSPYGASIAATGLADLAQYEGRLADAARHSGKSHCGRSCVQRMQSPLPTAPLRSLSCN